MVYKIVCHGRRVQSIAAEHGWLSGARYSNVRDVRHLKRLDFLDIDWKNYDLDRHLYTAKQTRPFMTVARDIVDADDLDGVLIEAEALAKFSRYVIVVPKAEQLSDRLEQLIPNGYILGYSMPSVYGNTTLDPSCFKRPTHLLGGRPDRQIEMSRKLNVFSVDCNRFTLDAAFGDYFDGRRFVPHPSGGYEACLRQSIANITALWKWRLELGDEADPARRAQA